MLSIEFKINFNFLNVAVRCTMNYISYSQFKTCCIELVISSHEDVEVTDKPFYHLMETSAGDPADSIYGVALIAAVGAALAMVIAGFGFGWYTYVSF